MHQALDKKKLQAVYAQVAGRYDLQHALLTLRSDQRGRELVAAQTVCTGDSVLDCGAGTGSTALIAAQKAGTAGSVVLFDMSEEMLSVARKRLTAAGFGRRVAFQTGDMLDLPFTANTFDVVLSTYSLCPLFDPVQGALEMYRVVKPGGRLGIAHSTEPENPLVKWLAARLEDVVWQLPVISLGCRSVSVLPALEKTGGRIIFKKHIGIPLWPFIVAIVGKPDT